MARAPVLTTVLKRILLRFGFSCPPRGIPEPAGFFLVTQTRDVRTLVLAFLCLVLITQITIGPARARVQPEACGSVPANSCTQGPATQVPRRLQLGEIVKQDIRGGQTCSFNLSLIAGQYVRLLIEQHGIILVADLFDGDGKPVIEMDNPSGAYGPIYCSTIAAVTGEYRLDLRSSEAWANAGQYEVSIEELREPTQADKDRNAAEAAFAAGRQLSNKATKDSRLAAIKKYEEALAYWSSTQDAHWEALTIYSIARSYRSLGQLQTAADYFEKMLPLHLSDHDWRLVASLLNDRGLNYSELGKHELALDSLNRAFKLYQDHQDKRGQASVFNNIGLTYHRIGALREALTNYEKAIPLRQSENDQQGEFNVRNNIGGIYDVSGEPLRALEQYRATLKVWLEFDKRDQLRDRDQLGIGFNNVAEALNKLGEWQQAIDGYEQALSIFQRTGNSQREAACLDNIGQLHQDLGEPTLAQEYYKKAQLLLHEKIKDPDAEGNVQSHIGSVNLSQGNLSEALQDFHRAFALRQSARGQGYALTNVGAVYFLQNNPQKALEAYDNALELLGKNGDQQGEAVTLYKRAEAYGLLRNQSQAREDFGRALSIWRSIANRRGEATTLLGIARAEGDLNRLDEAVRHSEAALTIIESLRTNVSSTRLRASYFAAQQNYYESNIELNMSLYLQNRSTQRLATSLNASEASRARSLIDMLNGARVDITEGVSQDLVKREHEIQQRLTAKSEAQTKLLSGKHSAEQADASAQEILELVTEDRDVRDRIRTNSPRYAHLTQPQPLTLPEIQNLVDENTLLLEYSLGDKRSYVWAVTPDAVKGFELKGRKEIEATAERMNKALTERNRSGVNVSPQQVELHRVQADAEYSKAAAELSKLVIEPVAALLGNKRLVIVPDGALQLVSFGALLEPQSATPSDGAARVSTPKKAGAMNDPKQLIQDHEIVYEASASVLALQRKEFGSRQPARHALAVLADPVFDQEGFKLELENRRAAKARNGQPQPGPNSSRSSGDTSARTRSDLMRAIDDMGVGSISALPESRDEAEAIMKVVPKGEGMAALGFDASRATVMSPGLSQYRIIHFATHGFADLDHPELSGIVLSLVDAKGQPQDGFLRLQVDDEATKYLMEEFYKQMFRNGLKPAAALQQAQLKLAHQSQWRSPFYWAGFVLQGEWK